MFYIHLKYRWKVRHYDFVNISPYISPNVYSFIILYRQPTLCAGQGHTKISPPGCILGVVIAPGL